MWEKLINRVLEKLTPEVIENVNLMNEQSRQLNEDQRKLYGQLNQLLINAIRPVTKLVSFFGGDFSNSTRYDAINQLVGYGWHSIYIA